MNIVHLRILNQNKWESAVAIFWLQDPYSSSFVLMVLPIRNASIDFRAIAKNKSTRIRFWQIQWLKEIAQNYPSKVYL